MFFLRVSKLQVYIQAVNRTLKLLISTRLVPEYFPLGQNFEFVGMPHYFLLLVWAI